MSIYKIGPDDVEFFALETNPVRQYSVDSSGSVSGSIHVLSRRTDIIKEVSTVDVYDPSTPFKSDTSVESYRQVAQTTLSSSVVASERFGSMNDYLAKVASMNAAARFSATSSIYCFQTPVAYNSDAERRLLAQRMGERQAFRYGPESQWSTTNYHCLNFYNNQDTSTGSVLIYPNNIMYRQKYDPVQGYVRWNLDNAGNIESLYQTYQLANSFSFHFWIKPKYHELVPSYEYPPGCVLHNSASYAIFLHSGSQRDEQGFINSFRFSIQLGNDTNAIPTNVGVDHIASPQGSGYTFWSSDNVLPRDEWSCITITYGGPNYDNGTGSVWVNGVKDRDIAIGNLIPVGTASWTGVTAVGALFLGNYYEAQPQDGFAMDDPYEMSRFWWSSNPLPPPGVPVGPGDFEGYLRFSQYVYNKLYVEQKLDNVPAGVETFISLNYTPNVPSYGQPPYDFPLGCQFRHPLSAELHDVMLFDKMLTYNDIQRLKNEGPSGDDFDYLRFYVPPFYVGESPVRNSQPITPFQSTNSDYLSSSQPFANKLAFGVGGLYPNLENYLIDFGSYVAPVQWGLRWFEQSPPSSAEMTANSYLYNSGSYAPDVTKRLYTVLPCDHGGYKPRFDVIKQKRVFSEDWFTDSFGSYVPGRILLTDLINMNTGALSARSLLGYADDLEHPMTNQVLGARPELPTIDPGSSLAVLHRLQSPDSHMVVVFDISNLYYGESIKPGTVTLTTNNLSGSNGLFGITLKDNGRGGLYRADTTGTTADWSTVGVVLYDEGLIVLKYPQLFFFAEKGWELSFNGTQNVYVYTINAVVSPMKSIESTDPGYSHMVTQSRVDTNANEYDQSIVYVGSVLVHDENLNVIMRTNLAQPVLKKSSDKMLFKVKMDW